MDQAKPSHLQRHLRKTRHSSMDNSQLTALMAAILHSNNPAMSNEKVVVWALDLQVASGETYVQIDE